MSAKRPTKREIAPIAGEFGPFVPAWILEGGDGYNVPLRQLEPRVTFITQSVSQDAPDSLPVYRSARTDWTSSEAREFANKILAMADYADGITSEQENS